jgi:hypothetical protein
MFGHEGVIDCPQFATLAQAKDWINQRIMFAIRNHSSIETTKWKPEGAYDETSVATTSAPQAPTPKPVTPPPPKPATPAPSKPVVAVIVPSKVTYLTCNSNSFTDKARYYNPPIEVTSGDYASWQASFQKYLQTNYKYGSGVSCNDQKTLADAQSYFKEITDTARLTTKDNLDRPWPVVITNWKYP